MTSSVLRSGALLAIGAAFVLGSACSGSDSSGGTSNTLGGTGATSGTGATGTGGTSGTGTGGTATGATGTGATAGTGGATAADLCGGNCACSNGIDDDGDGKIDGFDPECTGPLDNDEGTFATGIPGDNSDPFWQDCFFDGNSGAGDDGCRYHTDCLYGLKEPTDPDCTLSQNCIDFCKARTPNGCDCFGCCDVTATDGTTYHVFLSASCSLDNITDEKACPRCTPSDACGNTCGTCELCLGRDVSDLPPECTPDQPEAGVPDAPPPPAYTCDNGEQVCSETVPCSPGWYCQLGCCLPFIR